MADQQARQQWAEKQAKVMLAAGIDPVTVAETVKAVMALLPDEDVNLAEWVPAPEDLDFEVTAAGIQDARVAWYASPAVPAKYKRILDARKKATTL